MRGSDWNTLFRLNSYTIQLKIRFCIKTAQNIGKKIKKEDNANKRSLDGKLADIAFCTFLSAL